MDAVGVPLLLFRMFCLKSLKRAHLKKRDKLQDWYFLSYSSHLLLEPSQLLILSKLRLGQGAWIKFLFLFQLGQPIKISMSQMMEQPS